MLNKDKEILCLKEGFIRVFLDKDLNTKILDSIL